MQVFTTFTTDKRRTGNHMEHKTDMKRLKNVFFYTIRNSYFQDSPFFALLK